MNLWLLDTLIFIIRGCFKTNVFLWNGFGPPIFTFLSYPSIFFKPSPVPDILPVNFNRAYVIYGHQTASKRPTLKTDLPALPTRSPAKVPEKKPTSSTKTANMSFDFDDDDILGKIEKPRPATAAAKESN